MSLSRCTHAVCVSFAKEQRGFVRSGDIGDGHLGRFYTRPGEERGVPGDEHESRVISGPLPFV